MLSLLKTSEELRRYVSVDTSVVPEPVQREQERLRGQLLLPVLGATLLHWLDAQYAAGAAATDQTPAGQLLARVQAPLARLAMAGALDELQVSLGDTGIHIVSTETQKTAFQWQITALRRTLSRKGYQDMNALLEWLESSRATTPELQAWAAGPGQLYRRQLLVSAVEFSRFENIQESWPVFEALRPLISTQELFILEPQLGYDFLSELREQVRTRTLTAENEELLEQFVRPALASLTLARAVPELGLRLTGDGIELMVARLDDSNSKEADAGLDQLLAARAFEAQRAADIRLEKMRQFLNRTASATRYATYFTLGPYRAPATPVVALNTAESKVIRFC
ncbi:DUF6712 family protein [Hymenobacter yonginensis]|uniref:Uncharacterized protein n=1 Tax=Hymenobacter yonginensis TaxID=748197 RepID=A0ABY7PTM0_9BACT|nr:DUF6712 family protein [Hymenobacter yonginensis]WBO86250.1 hypothetical protein O9Z63_08305 [Hymenobacter yonginensis]